jgi:DNA-binding MarR family transcriptional regulator
LGFSDFTILYHLSQAKDEKMRRIDLAEKVGLTASGITRLLAPMEKIGLVKREKDSRDARVSFVAIAQGGKRKLSEALEDAELVARELIPAAKTGQIEELSQLVAELGDHA